MKERPILFSGEMVRAILEARKTQTRRVVQPQPVYEGKESYGDSWAWKKDALEWFSGVTTEQLAGNHGLCYPGRCPYGQPGDRLWVRETLQRNDKFLGTITFAATPHLKCTDPNATDNLDGWSLWRFKRPVVPAIHMPRWASRLTLELTEVRVERVQDISEADARAEGISVLPLQSESDPSAWYQSAPGIHQDRSARASFSQLWDSINAKRDGGIYSWEKNPWVWALTFRRVEA